MDNVVMSENNESKLVLGATISGAVASFCAAAPLPLEWKAPISGLTATVCGGLLAYWKLKVNKIQSAVYET